MKISKENKAGLYITVIFHLTVIIVLMSAGIGSALKGESSFVLDFSKQEELEKQEKEVAFKDDISKKLDDLIAAAKSTPSTKIKNIAVDAGSSALKDDRGTDAQQLYKDAQRLASELKNGQRDAIEEQAKDETVELPSKNKNEEKKAEYKGPSVVSYTLDGRKASHLKIPAYRCYGAGDVMVIITVDPKGNVIGAKVQEEVSADDKCLRDYAIRAARLSKFSISPDAPARQNGEILYRFIAQ